MGIDSPRYALQKALAVTRTPALLDSVAEVYMGENKTFHVDARDRIIYKTPYLLFPAIVTLVKAIPAMQQLRTIRLARMSASKMELYSILSSPCLIHLILDRVQIPKLNIFPPPTLRKLTLTAMFSWESVEILIGQLANSLEYLELQQCKFRALRPLSFPPFPRLQEFRHDQGYIRDIFPDGSRLSELFHLGSQITHLHLSGSFHHVRAAAFPTSLQQLSIGASMLTEQNFGTSPLHGLLSLSIEHCERGKGPWRLEPRLRLLPSLIRDCFPGITSLQLHIQWSLRNMALVIARSQRNVRVLKLVINTTSDLDHEEKESTRLGHHDGISAAHLLESTSPAALQSLRLDVTQTCNELERSVAPCTRWVENDPMTGVGGPDLKSVDAFFFQPEGKLVQERVLRRRWIKSIEGDWEMDRYLS